MLMHCTMKMSYTENVCMSNWVMSCMCIGQMYPFKHFHLRPSASNLRAQQHVLYAPHTCQHVTVEQ